MSHAICVTGYLRRRLCTAAVRANVPCLLERMVLVEEGLGQAGRMRMWARRRKARLDREKLGTGADQN